MLPTAPIVDIVNQTEINLFFGENSGSFPTDIKGNKHRSWDVRATKPFMLKVQTSKNI